MVHLLDIENYAKENNIPIMQKDGIEFLTNYIKEHNVKKILEIGCAIGYSAIRMCLVHDDISVVTVCSCSGNTVYLSLNFKNSSHAFFISCLSASLCFSTPTKYITNANITIIVSISPLFIFLNFIIFTELYSTSPFLL